MKKRWVALTTVGMVAAGVLMGCGSAKKAQQDVATAQTEVAVSQQAEAQEKAESKSGESAIIRCSWWGGDLRHQAMLKVIEDYEKKNPGITVEGEYQGDDGYYEKMMTTLSSGTAPDIMLFKREWLADVQGAKHYLADLGQLPVDTSTLAEGLLEKSGTYKDEAVLFPCTVTGQVMYVNKDFASKHGMELDKTYTWDEFMDLGKTIHEEDQDSYLMTADIDVLNRLIIPSYLAQMTGTCLVNDETYELNFTQEQMEKAFQLVKDLYSSNTVEPFGEGSVFAGQMDQNTKWVNGQIGLLLDITGGLAKYKASISSELDVLPIPRNTDAKCSGVDFAGNTGFCINDNSAVKEEAAKFLDYLLNDPEAALIIKSSYGYNSTSTAIAALEEKGEIDATLKKAIEIAQPDSMTSNAVSNNTELETLRKDILQEVIYEDITPAEAAEEIVNQYQKILSELKS